MTTDSSYFWKYMPMRCDFSSQRGRESLPPFLHFRAFFVLVFHLVWSKMQMMQAETWQGLYAGADSCCWEIFHHHMNKPRLAWRVRPCGTKTSHLRLRALDLTNLPSNRHANEIILDYPATVWAASWLYLLTKLPQKRRATQLSQKVVVKLNDYYFNSKFWDDLLCNNV